MKNGIAEIDHLLTYVRDLNQATQAYERLGFTLTPISDITAMGIANRLALLKPRIAGAASFIELMSASDRARLPAAMAQVLSGPERIKSMVMMTPDARAAHQELVSNSYGFAPPVHVKREWVIPGEASVWPEFDVLMPIPAPLAFNACQYHNVNLYLRPDWQQHANGAQTLNAVFAVAPDANEVANYYAELFGKASLEHGAAQAVSPGHTWLEVFSPKSLEARFGPGNMPETPDGWASSAYLGYQIGVADLTETRSLLSKNGVRFSASGTGLVVAASEACGNLVEFVENPI
jgi:hypothetical protein